eukprot:1585763-Prymnesium_polylepis.3
MGMYMSSPSKHDADPSPDLFSTTTTAHGRGSTGSHPRIPPPLVDQPPVGRASPTFKCSEPSKPMRAA